MIIFNSFCLVNNHKVKLMISPAKGVRQKVADILLFTLFVFQILSDLFQRFNNKA